MTRRYAIVDRDGTINAQTRGAYVLAPDDVVLLPGAAEGLRGIADAGLGIVVVSNQAAVARGWITAEQLDRVNARLLELLAAEGVPVDGVYCCPHDDGDGCGCRKPQPGLLLQAAADQGFDVREAFLIGDKASDVEAGRRAGATTVLVRTGEGAGAEGAGPRPDHVAVDLVDAAAIIARLAGEPIAQRRPSGSR